MKRSSKQVAWGEAKFSITHDHLKITFYDTHCRPIQAEIKLLFLLVAITFLLTQYAQYNLVVDGRHKLFLEKPL
jgi:hypothetical protein